MIWNRTRKRVEALERQLAEERKERLNLIAQMTEFKASVTDAWECLSALLEPDESIRFIKQLRLITRHKARLELGKESQTAKRKEPHGGGF
jgi:hypothetical protein